MLQSAKMLHFMFLPEERSRSVYVSFSFFMGDRIEPMTLEYRERAHSNGN